MAKTVPISKFTELKGLDRILRIAHEMNCLFREITKDDLGLDGEIEILVPKASGKGYETTGGILKVQAKSGESYVKADDGISFVTPVSKEDLDYWTRCSFPVLLIVYHPRDDMLYFKEIKSYIRSTTAVLKPPYCIRFDKQRDEFSASSRDSLCHHASVSPPRIAFGQRERILSNLLPVKKVPNRIRCSSTRWKTRDAVLSEANGSFPPFCIREGLLYTLADLYEKDCPLRRFCSRRVNEIRTGEWIEDDQGRRDFIFLLHQLLGSHERRCGLRYNPDFKRVYFPRENDDDKEFKRNWISVRTAKAAPARIVCKYYEYGTFNFWRHLAAGISFKQIAQRWFLQIIPRYLFTRDGSTPCESDLVGPYTTQLKADEHNIHVLNHVLFWADVLSQQKPFIHLELDGEIVMKIDKLPTVGIADFAITHDPATYEEKAPSRQSWLFNMWADESEEDDEY